MTGTRRPGSWALCALAFLAVLGSTPGTVHAETSRPAVPENARALSYGSGWTCNRGYRAVGDGCEAIRIPDDAFATDTTYGRQWECNRGFLASLGKICTAIPVPTNGYLNASGDDWSCERGFRRAAGTCVAVKPPANGYLNATGDGWECDRGYRAGDLACVAVKLPANAYPTFTTYGHGWECDRGYQEIGETCAAVTVPKNGYFVESSYGLGWKCERGYQPVNKACLPVAMPENAHLGYSGNDWDCNRPYRKGKTGCVLPADG